MDVHHHPELPHKEKKKFKDYLLEGMMIFLAVFLGFIAENLREHISDSSKERNYIKGLYTDLRQDSVKLADVQTAGLILQKGQDSLLAELSKVSQANPADKVYNLFFRYAVSEPMFTSTDRTMSQLINSGSFRLIGDQALADSVSNYYDKVKDTSFQANLDNNAALDCIQFSQNIFKLDYGLHPMRGNKTLITYDPAVIEKYRNKLIEMRIAQQYYIQKDLKDLDKSCQKLLVMLHNAI